MLARLERLVAAGAELAQEYSLAGVLERSAKIAAEVTGARYAAIGLLGPDGRTLERFVTEGIPEEQRRLMGNLPQGHGVLGVVIRDGKVLRLDDLSQHPDSRGLPPHHPPMRTFLGVPVIGRRGIIGDLYVTEKVDGGHFTPEDEHLAILLAQQTAAAVENAGLHEEGARLLEEVQQLQRARERFFAMVNHELRNALAATYGWAEMLVRKKDPGTIPKAAFEVLESAEGAIGLVNDLLDLSRLDENRLRPEFRDFSAALVVRNAISRVTPQALASDVAVGEFASPNLPDCHSDLRRVEQILINLLINAIRHSPKGGHVSVHIDLVDQHLAFRILDQGAGVPEADRERIFDIYQTDDSSGRTGIGLGLPLSRRLAHLLGGRLFTGPRVGPGAEFVLELPISQTAS